MRYPMVMEISGPIGFFARLDSGSDSASYVVPPASTCKGMFESVCRVLGADIIIAAIGICRPPVMTSYSYNSHSPIRKTDLLRKMTACQISHSALENPAFQIIAYAINNPIKAPPKYKNINNAHSLQEQFNRRLITGRAFRTPCLGRKEMLATYWGVPITSIDETYNATIPTLVHGDYNSPTYYGTHPSSIQNVKIENGVLRFTADPVKVVNGILQFDNEGK